MPSLRLLPHGGYTLIPAVLSTVAWLASLSQDGCDYARLTGFLVAQVTQSKEVEFLEVGLTAYREPILEGDIWKIQYTGTCLAYDETIFEQDVYWTISKAFAFIALVLGGGGALFLWFSSCFVFSRGTWKWAGYEVLLASISQTSSFLWFLTKICNTGDSACTLSYGSKADIAAAACWLTAALSIFHHYPAIKEPVVEDVEVPHATVIDDDYSSQGGGEDTWEGSGDVEDVLPVEGDAKASLFVADDKNNDKGTIVQTTPAQADLL